MMSTFVGAGMSMSMPKGGVAQIATSAKDNPESCENNRSEHGGILPWYFTHGSVSPCCTWTH